MRGTSPESENSMLLILICEKLLESIKCRFHLLSATFKVIDDRCLVSNQVCHPIINRILYSEDVDIGLVDRVNAVDPTDSLIFHSGVPFLIRKNHMPCSIQVNAGSECLVSSENTLPPRFFWRGLKIK